MKNPIFSIAVVALLAMTSASDMDDIDMLTGVDLGYMVGLCKVLTHQGYITELKKEDCDKKNVVELIDLAIKANELAKQKSPETASDRDVNIAFLKNARRKWINVNPNLETNSAQSQNEEPSIQQGGPTSEPSDHDQGSSSPLANQPTESDTHFNQFSQGNSQQSGTLDEFLTNQNSHGENGQQNQNGQYPNGQTQTHSSDESDEDRSGYSTQPPPTINGMNVHPQANEFSGLPQNSNSIQSSYQTTTLPNEVNDYMPQGVPANEFTGNSQGSDHIPPSFQTTQSPNEFDNYLPQSNPNSEHAGFSQSSDSIPTSFQITPSPNELYDQQGVPTNELPDFSQGSDSIPSMFHTTPSPTKEVNDRLPQDTPNNKLPSSSQSSNTIPSSSHVPSSSNDRQPNAQLNGVPHSGNSNGNPSNQWQNPSWSSSNGRPDSVQNPSMNPSNFLPVPGGHPSGHSEYPPYPQAQYPQQQYPQQQYPQYYPQQQYPTKPPRGSGGGLFSTITKFVGKLF